uniref:protein-tyrosine-phosphatase n=1 Tax=Monosiga ovata TaxID=81526 RepID=E5RKE6_9EUKA|nr:protein tyrosine phosphatase [Monosiga ovata]
MRSSNAVANVEFLTDAFETIQSLLAERIHDDSFAKFTMAYETFNTIGMEHTCDVGQKPENRLKNRYQNIMPYDHSRVVLPVIDNDPDSDYINANYVASHRSPRGYIATQGPVPASFTAFWRMVWHTKADAIVMLTQEIEAGKMKCHRYWPDASSTPSTPRDVYGPITVTHILSEAHPHYLLREFRLECGRESRLVRQYAYLSWPDHGTPLTTDEMLHFRHAIRASGDRSTGPMIVHCSAGVGRTGTFIGLDAAIEQCLDGIGPIDIGALLVKMRHARNYMIQTDGQYLFLFQAVQNAIAVLLADDAQRADGGSGGERQRGRQGRRHRQRRARAGGVSRDVQQLDERVGPEAVG